jgi:hypothetical protein
LFSKRSPRSGNNPSWDRRRARVGRQLYLHQTRKDFRGSLMPSRCRRENVASELKNSPSWDREKIIRTSPSRKDVREPSSLAHGRETTPHNVQKSSIANNRNNPMTPSRTMQKRNTRFTFELMNMSRNCCC